MGEYVWTTVEIGGKVKAGQIPAFEELLRYYTWHDQPDGVGDIEIDGDALVLQGERNFGSIEDIEPDLQELGLSYRVTWAAQPGCFGSGTLYWRPGMEKPQEWGADDDGNTTVSFRELEDYAAGGLSLEDVIAKLKPAVEAIPPFEIEEEEEAPLRYSPVNGEIDPSNGVAP